MKKGHIIISVVAIICVTALLITLIITSKMVPKLENGKDAVVTIGKGKDISADDLYDKLKEQYALNVLIDMIDTQLLNDKYKTTKEEKEYVDAQIEQLKYYYQSYYASTYSSFEEMLVQAYGVNSEDEARKVMSLNYKRDKATEDYIADKLTDDEIQKYYDDEIIGDMKASHILISADYDDDATEEEISAAKEEAFEKAEDIIKELNKVKNDKDALEKKFTELAKENSDDEATASNGGDLDYFNKGEMDASFESATIKLKVGEYTSKPVESSYGYHIIYKTDEKDKKALKDVKDEVIEKLVEKKKNEDTTLQAKALEQLRKDYKVSFKDSTLKKQYKTYLENSKNSNNNNN